MAVTCWCVTVAALALACTHLNITGLIPNVLPKKVLQCIELRNT